VVAVVVGVVVAVGVVVGVVVVVGVGVVVVVAVGVGVGVAVGVGVGVVVVVVGRGEMSEPKISDSERKMLDLLRIADAVLLYHDDGCRAFSWIRGLSEAPARVTVEYGQLDGKRMVRRLKANIGVTQREFDEAVQRGEGGDERRGEGVDG
jgi:hypothetical protein